MKNITAGATAGLAAVALGLVLVGCGSSTETEATTETTTTETTSEAPASPQAAGPSETLNQYITNNEIAETPIKPDEPGTPTFDFPLPPDWSDAGDMTPDWAYGAIVYDMAQDPDDPPALYAIASKLTGDVDAAKILEYAPGQLRDLPEFKPLEDPNESSLSGFDAIAFAGTYVDDGATRFIAQKTVVVPAQDGLFVLQLNGEAPDGEQDLVLDAAKIIDEQTTITPPS